MQQELLPVDVICLSKTCGEVLPLRFRINDGKSEGTVCNVCEVLATRENRRIGAENRSFLCRIRSDHSSSVLELKFFLRTHSWYLARSGFEK